MFEFHMLSNGTHREFRGTAVEEANGLLKSRMHAAVLDGRCAWGTQATCPNSTVRWTSRLRVERPIPAASAASR